MCNNALGSALLSAGLLIANPAVAQDTSSTIGNVALTRANDRVLISIKRAL